MPDAYDPDVDRPPDLPAGTRAMRTKGGIPLKNYDFNAPSHYEWVSIDAGELTDSDIEQLEHGWGITHESHAATSSMMGLDEQGHVINGVSIARLDGEDCVFAVVIRDGQCKWAERKLVS